MKIALAVCVMTIWVATATSAQIQSLSEEEDMSGKVIVREGHRVVVVEYDENGHHNTKVSISPLEKSSEDVHHGRGAGELICDAYGKCKQKMASTFGRASDNDNKDASYYYDEAVKDGAYRAKDTAKEAVEDQIYNTKEAVTDRAHYAKERVKDGAYHAKDMAKEAVEDQIHKVRDTAHNTKEAVKGRAHHAKEAVKDGAYRVKDIAEEAVEDQIYKVRDAARNTKEAVKDRAHHAKEAVKDGAKEAVGNALPSISHVMSVVSLLGFSTALGTSIWISLVSSYVLARSLGRQQFGVVQSKLHPAYFKLMACCIGAALLGHLLRHRKRLSNPAEMYQAYNLAASLLLVLANLILIEPRATKVMFERMKIQKEDGRGVGELQTPTTTRTVASRTVNSQGITSTAARASIQTPLQETVEDDAVRTRVDEVNRKLKRYNSSSSLLNMLTVMSLLWHLVYFSQLLQDCYP